MDKFDQIVAGITVDTYEDDQAEWAIAQRLRDVVDDEMDVEVAGKMMVLETIEAASRRQRVRAVVCEGEGRWRVSLDALGFAPNTAAAVFVDAYRHWLGYEEQTCNAHGEGASRAVCGERLQRRISALESAIHEALTTGCGVHLETISSIE